jgi:hypothetical protein
MPSVASSTGSGALKASCAMDGAELDTLRRMLAEVKPESLH